MVLEPIRYALRRVARLDRLTLRDVAQRSWVVHPAETAVRSPAIHLEGQLERVEAVQEETSRDFEIRRVLGGSVEHAATVAYELAGAVIAGGSVYAGGMRLSLLRGRPSPADLGPIEEHLPEASLACTYVGNRYFAHWIHDDGPLRLLGREYAEPVAVERPEYRHEEGYSRMLDLGVRRLRRARVERLLVFQDFGQNSGKRLRLERIRAAAASAGPRARTQRVYLRRGTSGVARPLVNESEVEARLARQGFAIVDPEASTAEQVLDQCRGAEIVVGVEGSQLVHGILGVAAPGGVLLALQPPWRFNNLFKDFADCLGFRYAFVVGTRAEPGGFRVDGDDLARTLDLVGGP